MFFYFITEFTFTSVVVLKQYHKHSLRSNHLKLHDLILRITVAETEDWRFSYIINHRIICTRITSHHMTVVCTCFIYYIEAAEGSPMDGTGSVTEHFHLSACSCFPLQTHSGLHHHPEALCLQ
jgi:hypothetical protein